MPDNDSNIGVQAINHLTSKLIDVSKRNRLLNTPVPDLSKKIGASIIPIISPDITKFFSLVSEKDKIIEIESIEQQPVPFRQNSVDFNGKNIVSSYSSKQLSSSLKLLKDRGKASINEKGVNIIFAAIGFVEWNDPKSANDQWRAPLILVPISVEGKSSKYFILGGAEDVSINPALFYKFSYEYGIDFPDFETKLENNEIEEIFSEIEKTISNHNGNNNLYLKLSKEMSLGIFSFAKIAMFKELKSLGFENLLSNSIISSLVQVGNDKDKDRIPTEVQDLDLEYKKKFCSLVVEADSSQMEAISLAQSGCNLAIQGPPGTGKSQTIVNLIADALYRGKKVLFVAEKRVALDVVYKRLKEVKLTDYCLVIHPGKGQNLENSGSINKKEIINEIQKTLDSDSVIRTNIPEGIIDENENIKQKLNSYVKELHQPRYDLQKSLFELLNRVQVLNMYPDINIFFSDAKCISRDELFHRQRFLDDFLPFKEFLLERGDKYFWSNLYQTEPNYEFVRNLEENLIKIIRFENEILDLHQRLEELLKIRITDEFFELEQICKFLVSYKLELILLPNISELINKFSGKYSNIFKFLFKKEYTRDCNELQKYWLKEWKDIPQEIAKDISIVPNLKEILHLPNDYLVDYNLIEVDQISSKILLLIPSLQDCYKFFSSIFPLESIHHLQINLEISKSAAEWSQVLLSQIKDINTYIRFRNLLNSSDCIPPIKEIINFYIENNISTDKWRLTYEKCLCQNLINIILNESGPLASFKEEDQEKLIDRFKELDSSLVINGQKIVNSELSQKKPRITGEISRANSSEIGILLREFKRKRIMPLRKLFSSIPNVLLNIKPCLLMSPLTVSQYLDPLVFNFDVVIFDEASQLRMEDAIGSIYRAKQVIVVGDEQQLPPTHFFDAMDSEEDFDEGNCPFLEVVDYESILTRAEAENRIFHPVSLRWHYRSKNEDLIAFSNKNFYNNRLYTFPNPYLGSLEKGVSFIYVPEGMYDRGRSRTNIPEAQRVVNECIKFAEQNPNLSLGVVTFSEPQRQVIQDFLDTSLISKPELINYFSENNPNSEPFIIKNLELIQGDERDAIFISFGYGPDQTNFFSQNFGPLNQEAGRRRLNVAVTRARRMVKVFSSVEPEKLTSDTPGVRLMREYLTLARDGVNALFGNMTTGEEMGEVESPFEESVAIKLREKGLEVRSQIGCSGFRIDLGIVDPTNPGRFVLGVECDGATYHSERTARDRDRLRQQVLENLGWHIVRIWSRTWFENPQCEIEKILNEVQRYQGKNNPIQEKNVKKEKIVCELVHVEKSTLSHDLSIKDIYPKKFSEQKKLIDGFYSPDDFIVKIVEYEGPKQKEAFLKRIANSMGYSRMGNNIRSNIEWSISRAIFNKKVVCSGDPTFIYPNKNYLATLPKTNIYSRKIDEIPIEECYLAIWLSVIAAGGSVEIDDAFKIAGDLFGFARITSDISDRFCQAINKTDEIFSMGHSNADSKIILCNYRLGLE